MSTGSVLLLTRPRPQSERFLKLCEERLGRSIPSVISPVIQIAKVGAGWDLSAETLVVTSANAVRVLGDALSGRRVATVGEATAGLARSFGAKAACLGETAVAFLERTAELIPPVVVARGTHARMDLAAELSARGKDARSVTVYDQVAMDLTPEATEVLIGSAPVVAPVFSPRSALLLSAYPIDTKLNVAAISPAALDAWRGPGTVFVAERPDAEAMCDLVAELL